MSRATVVSMAMLMLWTIGCATHSDRELRSSLRRVCWPEDGESGALGTFMRSGEAGRDALLALAGSSNDEDAQCGIGALSLLGDTRVVPPMVKRLNRANGQSPDARWVLPRTLQLAAYAESTTGLGQLVPAVAHYLTGAQLLDAFGTLGYIDTVDARTVVTSQLRTAAGDQLAGAIFAAALLQIPDLLPTIQQFEHRIDLSEPERRRWIALYYLLFGSDTLQRGLALLEELPKNLQDLTAGWAVQSLCIRERRHADRAKALADQRQRLITEFRSRGLDWRHAPWNIPCE